MWQGYQEHLVPKCPNHNYIFLLEKHQPFPERMDVSDFVYFWVPKNKFRNENPWRFQLWSGRDSETRCSACSLKWIKLNKAGCSPLRTDCKPLHFTGLSFNLLLHSRNTLGLPVQFLNSSPSFRDTCLKHILFSCRWLWLLFFLKSRTAS